MISSSGKTITLIICCFDTPVDKIRSGYLVTERFWGKFHCLHSCSLRCEFILPGITLVIRAIKMLSTVQGAVDKMMYKLLSSPCSWLKSSREKATKGMMPSCEQWIELCPGDTGAVGGTGWGKGCRKGCGKSTSLNMVWKIPRVAMTRKLHQQMPNEDSNGQQHSWDRSSLHSWTFWLTKCHRRSGDDGGDT